jgi:pyruvate dehydrogenase (quinone)
VFNSQDLNEVTWEQRLIEQSKVRCLTAHLRLRISRLQRDARVQGYLRNDRLASAWQGALSTDRPMVLEVKADPEVAPLPSHVTFKQARGFMSAMAKSDGGTGGIIGETAHQSSEDFRQKEMNVRCQTT